MAISGRVLLSVDWPAGYRQYHAKETGSLYRMVVVQASETTLSGRAIECNPCPRLNGGRPVNTTSRCSV
jgi:hypothetical protein